VGGFKDYLGADDIRYCEQALARLDKLFGYSREAKERGSISSQ
jgi:hypothetical protein